jgi:hypothetical protein
VPVFEPGIWDDRQFLSLSRDAKLLWLWLLTCESPVPGLIRGGIASLAESLRFEREEVMRCVRELLDRGMVEFDEPHRLLRRLDALQRPWNPNVLKGWYRKWKTYPESPLKYHHVRAIHESLGGKWEDVWQKTFGTVRPAAKEVSAQCNLLPDLVESPSEILSPGSNNLASETTLSEGCYDRDRDRSRNRDPSTLSKALSPEARLWQLQEGLRGALGLAALPPAEEDLERVRECVKATSEDDAQRVIGVYYEEARADRSKCRFFNGTTNWKIKNFRRALSMAPPAGNGASDDPTGARAAAEEAERTSAELAELRRDALPAAEALKLLRQLADDDKPSSGHSGSESL